MKITNRSLNAVSRIPQPPKANRKTDSRRTSLTSPKTYSMNAAFMSQERHERGNHVVSADPSPTSRQVPRVTALHRERRRSRGNGRANVAAPARYLRRAAPAA